MGLPSLIVSRLMSSPEQVPEKLSLEIYGPPGIVDYLQATLPLAMKAQQLSQLVYLTVYELAFSKEHLQVLTEQSSYHFPWAKEQYDEQCNNAHRHTYSNQSPNHNHDTNTADSDQDSGNQKKTLFKHQRIFADAETGYWTLQDNQRVRFRD